MSNVDERYDTLPRDIVSRTDLTWTAKGLLMVLRRYHELAARNCDQVRPGVRRIGAEMGVDKGSVQRAAEQLRAAGLIRIDRPAAGLLGSRRKRSCRYRLIGVERTQNADVDVVERTQNADVGQNLAETQRTQNADVDVRKMRTLESLNVRKMRTKRTIREQEPKNRARKADEPDPWTVAESAMTGDVLKTDDFKQIWNEWIEYRRQARHPMTAVTVARQIHTLERWGHAKAIEAIGRSIENGWRGLFEPRNEGTRPAHGPCRQERGRYRNPDADYSNIGERLEV